MNSDPINPPHYKGVEIHDPADNTALAIQPIDVIEVLELGFHLGNALKYAWRLGRKHARVEEEIAKGNWYLDRFRSSGGEAKLVADNARDDAGDRPGQQLLLAGNLRNFFLLMALRVVRENSLESGNVHSYMRELVSLLGIEEQLWQHAAGAGVQS